MKKLSKFQADALAFDQLKEIKGGGGDCHKSYSQSEVDFLMRANNWDKHKAKKALYWACVYAAVANK